MQALFKIVLTAPSVPVFMVCSSGSLTALSLMMIFFRLTGAVSVLNALVISATSCIGFRASCTGHPLRYSMHRTQCSMHWSSPLVLKHRPRRSMPWSSSAALSVPVSVLTALAIISGAPCTGLSAQCTGPHPLCHPPISALNALVIICCIMYLSQRSMH